MNNLLFGIENIIKNNIEEYVKLISQKYENIDEAELMNLWDNLCKSELPEKKEIKEKEIKEKKVKEKKDKLENSSNNVGCPYVFSKGENKGSICGSKPKTGAEFCSKHQKFKGVGQTEKKKLPKAKSISSASSVASSVSKKKSPSKKPIEKILRLNKEIDKFWDEDTQLVFKSRDERIVIGSYRDDNLNDLTEDDILLCQQFGFKYEDLNSVKSDEEEEEDEEEVEIITKKVTKISENKEKLENEHKKIDKEEKIENKINKDSKKPISENKLKNEEKTENKINKDSKKLISENKLKNEEPKKTIMNEINKVNNINIKDIESVLNELQLGDDDDEVEEYEEIIEEDVEDELLDEDY